jgi:hypothetical protein
MDIGGMLTPETDGGNGVKGGIYLGGMPTSESDMGI